MRVGLRLVVAERLGPLAGELARLLDPAPVDPFAAELVAVPSAGVRAWLTEQLAHRNGIVANVEMVFPGEVVRRALGPVPELQSWEVGPLTWAVRQALGTDDVLRARAVADLFDRYALHRVGMVLAWEAGHDVDAAGAPLPASARWQPELWRRLVTLLGGVSAVHLRADRTQALARGELDATAELPERVVVFGLGSLPEPHLEVLAALAGQHQVHVLAPVPSMPVWQRVAERARHHQGLSVPRSDDPLAGTTSHPLAATWATAQREAQYLSASATWRAGGSMHQLTDEQRDEPPDEPVTALAALQRGVRSDCPPDPAGAGRPADGDPTDASLIDRSIVWHRCHGPTRQVEVLRDQLLHLLEETDQLGRPRFEPRDIVVLCPDLATFAPLVEAAFLGDPSHGIPPLPVRIADRSLRHDLPLLDAVAALLELDEGRFRASEVLAFAARGPVRQRFGFTADDLEMAAAWVERTNICWGLDPTSHQHVGIPAELRAHSWRAGLDQLLVGAAMADDDLGLGPGDVPPLPGIEADQVVTLGRLADLVHALGDAHERLTRPLEPAAWCAELAEAAAGLFALPESDAWQWEALQRALDEFATEAQVHGEPVLHTVAPDQLAGLFASRLAARPGRVRFGTGAITVSSLVAQRGVPYPVVCLLGIDGDLGATRVAGVDDLTTAPACIGDREPQHELRAGLLDAVLAAGQRLVVCSTGRDLLSNAEVPPPVALAELVDLVSAVVGASGWYVDHPRQAWSERNFQPGAHGVPTAWSFHRGARRAAEARRLASSAGPAPASLTLPEPDARPIRLAELEQALVNPMRSLLQDRLGIRLARRAESITDLIPLDARGLDAWQLADDLLDRRLSAGDAWTDHDARRWWHRQQAAGCVPPLGRAAAAIDTATSKVDLLLAAARDAGVELHQPGRTIHVDLSGGPWQVHGDVAPVRANVLTRITPSRWKAEHLLSAWVRLAALTVHDPGTAWSAVLVTGSEKNSGSSFKVKTQCLRFHDPDHARLALEVAVDLHRRAQRSPVPALAATTYLLAHRGVSEARTEWSKTLGNGRLAGDGHDDWLTLVFESTDLDDVLALPPAPDEQGAGWGDQPARIQRWAHRIWRTLESTIEPLDLDG